jgi:hypothetical protein
MCAKHPAPYFRHFADWYFSGALLSSHAAPCVTLGHLSQHSFVAKIDYIPDMGGWMNAKFIVCTSGMIPAPFSDPQD